MQNMAEVAETGRKLFDSVTASLAATHISDDVTIYTRQVEQVDLDGVSLQEVEELHARKPGVIPKMWTPEEDVILRSAVEKHGEKNWREIAEEVPERNHLQCLQRWKKALKPGLVKGHWSKEEDNYLLHIMSDYETGKWNWAKISLKIPGRNAKQCRERWFLNLDPSINRGPWTEEEDAMLLHYHREFNGRWSLIAKELVGRTENSVKTRFHSLQRREVRSRGWIPEEDDVFVRGLRVYGRNYVLCARLLPGRSRGQLKKRFPVLCQMRPGLEEDIQKVDERIAQGHKPTPIHIMLKALQEERKQKKMREEAAIKEQAQYYDDLRFVEPKEAPVYFEPTPAGSHDVVKPRMKKFQSSWMDEILEDIADPQPVMNQSLPRVNSAAMLAELLNTDGDGQDVGVTNGIYESDTESLKSGSSFNSDQRRKGFTKKHSSLMVLDKLLNNMDDFGDVLSGDQAFLNPGYVDTGYNKVGAKADGFDKGQAHGRLRRNSSGWSKLFDDDYGQANDSQASLKFEDKTTQPLAFERSFSNGSWGTGASFHHQRSHDMPVV